MTAPLTARARQADRRRAELLDVALRLFAERGFEATTIADISAAAGTAHGLVYHYFPSKDELFLAVLERNSFLPSLRELLALAPDQPATEVLPRIATGFSAMLTERADFLSLVVRESQTNPAVAAAMGRLVGESLELLTAYLENRVAAGELRAHDVSVTARAIFQAIVAGHLNRLPAPGFELGLVDVVLHGVLAK
jgi:AcrR family transcriptional regulator